MDDVNYCYGDQIGSQGPGYVYDPDCEGPINFPDIGELLDTINAVLTYMCTDDMKALKVTDADEYRLKLEQQFPDFSFKYYNLFTQLISGNDISPLLVMLAAIGQVKEGKLTPEEAERAVGEGLAHKYVLPKLNKNKNTKNKYK